MNGRLAKPDANKDAKLKRAVKDIEDILSRTELNDAIRGNLSLFAQCLEMLNNVGIEMKESKSESRLDSEKMRFDVKDMLNHVEESEQLIHLITIDCGHNGQISKRDQRTFEDILLQEKFIS